ncbi:MAG: VWA domain-containing protein [Acidobacteriia bacterium]|nr:VWA domain-containing protein [Terriglobia bacterium]
MSSLADRIEIGNPTQPHCATVLLLDVSGSMDGEKISQLNHGLQVFKEEISKDDLASKRVDLAVISFGQTVQVVHGFSNIDDFEPTVLTANGATPMGAAILTAADMIEQRKQQYKSQGIDYYRPWIFMITDGAPTDMQVGDSTWNKVLQCVHEGESGKKFMFFAVAVDSAETHLLAQIAPPNRPPVRLVGTKFKEMFQWLSKSQAKVSSSKINDTVALENPVAAGWGAAST